MEEQVLKILKKNYVPLGETDDDETCAKEIESHVMEFIEWLREWTEPRVNGWAILDDDLGGYTTKPIGEVYQHWLTNIKK